MGFIPQSAWACFEKDENLVEIIQISKVTYAMLHGTFEIRHWNPISAIKPKKWMQYLSITIPKSFTSGIFPYLYPFFC
jgi:Zn-dependent M28 family amino/carboxypeptidase